MVDDAPGQIDPPDRGHLLTEQRLTASKAVDALPVRAVLELINTQDMRVPVIVRNAIGQIEPLVCTAVARMRQGGRLIYVGTGTSGRLGVLDASECPPTFHTEPSQVVGVIAGGDAALRKSSEAKEDDDAGPQQAFDQLNVNDRDVIVGLTAGGTTPYVWAALKLAKQRGSATALITCVPTDSLRSWQRAPLMAGNAPTDQLRRPHRAPLPVEVDHIIELPTGPEVVTGSTRMMAGGATKLALNMISTTVMIQLGKTWGNLMVDLRATNAKLIDRAARIVGSQCGLSRREAMVLLDRAQGRVKVALVMAKRRVEQDEAIKLLDQHHQRLRPIIGPPQ